MTKCRDMSVRAKFVDWAFEFVSYADALAWIRESSHVVNEAEAATCGVLCGHGGKAS